MNEKYYKALYDEAFRILGKTTPLKTDCGLICDKSCCKGDSETGMLLFPFEKTTLDVVEKNGRRLAVCKGFCKRNERPLACRLFPFFPTVDKNGLVKVMLDYRGIGICPLVSQFENVVFSKRFLHRVQRVGELLSHDRLCKEHMKKAGEEIAQAKNLCAMFEKV